MKPLLKNIKESYNKEEKPEEDRLRLNEVVKTLNTFLYRYFII